VQVFSKLARIAAPAVMIAGGLAIMMTVTACNTTAGIGQDVSATGKAVTNSAEKVKQGL